MMGTAVPRDRMSSPAESGEPVNTNARDYWVARLSLSSGGHSADPLAGDDGYFVEPSLCPPTRTRYDRRIAARRHKG
jgi:hypothetical protein